MIPDSEKSEVSKLNRYQRLGPLITIRGEHPLFATPIQDDNVGICNWRNKRISILSHVYLRSFQFNCFHQNSIINEYPIGKPLGFNCVVVCAYHIGAFTVKNTDNNVDDRISSVNGK